MDKATLAFLHTAGSNVEMFGQLLERIAPSIPTRHMLLERVLRDAVDAGTVTDSMRRQTEDAIRELVEGGATFVVCTCSTIGGIAEAVCIGDVPVMRIDRPMAEAAVASGRRIVVAASLPSTLGPTTDLIRQVAGEAGRAVEITEVLCMEAWPHFERGDRSAYARSIADTVAATTGAGDIVVLAQASMAPAAALINATGVLALASPELGVRAAVTAFGAGRRG